ncbi:MAG: 50S ribosomal protein L25 [Candidatus Azambacteria bacterium]|nr:50S ribosomal protein L25 [Candidatus Azambacteria bacterium]
MTTLELKSEKRTLLGKKVKSLRRDGILPAVVYGGKEGTTPIELNRKDFGKVLKVAGETTLVKLFVGEKVKNVLIHDIDRDAVTEEIRHVDFYEVNMDEKITTKVPLVFVGEAPAVSDLSGILVKAMQELEIRALPADLPHQIEVDISQLKTFNDNILVRDIKLPNNVETIEHEETSVAVVTPPRTEEELEALKGTVEEKVEEVAVETEEKVKERAEEKTEAAEK